MAIERFWWLLVTDPDGGSEIFGPTSVIYRIHARHCGVVRKINEDSDARRLNQYEFLLLWMSRKQVKKEFPNLEPQGMEAYK